MSPQTTPVNVDVTKLMGSPQCGVTRRMLLTHLVNPETIAAGETTDAALTGYCGMDVSPSGEGNHALLGAIRDAIKQGVLWERERGTGRLLCRDSSQKAQRVSHECRRIHRRAREAVEIASSVTVSELPRNEQPQFLARVAQVGTLAHLSSRDMQAKLKDVGAKHAIEPRQLLEALKEPQ